MNRTSLKNLAILCGVCIFFTLSQARAAVYTAIGPVNFAGVKGTEYTFGIGRNLPLKSNLYVGADLDVGYIGLKKQVVYAHSTGGGIVLYSSNGFKRAGVDIKFGYTYADFSLYGLGIVEYHHQTNWYALGLGSGGGVIYKPLKKLSFAAEYRNLQMQTELDRNYNYNVYRAIVKYRF